MKIRDILAQREEGVSFEFFPPKTAVGREGFMKTIHELAGYGPLFISVTCSPGSITHERTVNAITWIRQETELTVMPHLTCIAATQSSIDAVLSNYIQLGIENILALRGDPPRDVSDVSRGNGAFSHAMDLVVFVKKFNALSIAVAVYPEGHSESPDLEKDIEFTKMKVDAGADFALTQMFFDNAYFYAYLDKARKTGITIPILPGIMPVTDCRKVEEFAAFCKATIPEQLRKKMHPYLDRPEEMRKIGIEHAVNQCDDLRANGVKYLHFYTMNRAGVVSSILNSLKK